MYGVTLISLLVLALLMVVIVALALAPQYGLDRPAPTRLEVTASDGWPLTVFHRAPSHRRFVEPIVLCHGLANNHLFFEFQPPHNLAMALSDAGFDCYSVDLRGSGGSTPPHEGPWQVTFDDHVRLDVPAVLALLEARHGQGVKVIWVGHSLGGLLGVAASNSSLSSHLKALVTIGSPVFFPRKQAVARLLKAAQFLSPWGDFDARILRAFAPLAGRIDPGAVVRSTANLRNLTPLTERQLLANVFAPMWRGVLGQLEDWTNSNTFRSEDRAVDYRAALAELTVPVLVLGGTVDGLCPEEATRHYFQALQAPDKTLHVFGRANGQQEEYGHGDLVVGRNVETEVYPTIVEFARRVATPVA
jgi:pimeloyl-ACP methyl ester carboxylesterase